MYRNTIEATIGHTPLLPLERLCSHLPGRILVKGEFANPGGSVKDRAARAILDEAERTGQLSPGGTVIEATSGNMGIALAMLCAVRGYRCIILMPDTLPPERLRRLEAYGAEVLLTPGDWGMAGAVETAQALHRAIPCSFLGDQFRNTANPRRHYMTTGPEIWADTGGRIDILVAGVGTGGTLTGTGRFLKERNPDLQICAVEPAASPMLSGGSSGTHRIPGIGANFIPEILDRSLIDLVIPVTDRDAREARRKLACTEGILSGLSSGAAVYAALNLAAREENAGKTIVAILPDTGLNDLSQG